ncbi:IS1 family transposase [Nostoc flagelliforme FACHB-838]|uniref:IS1 family transposase n=1 Tax=Nostoc flagelliforme FACHB-838 TaxID=2692904 RepID=A0ABR8E5Q7_9NOSO|nr:IS1 family transposase [Nostoc flagelliforme FACHB-838]
MNQLIYAHIGKKHGKQNYICVNCGRQFIDSYAAQGYSEEIKQECLEMYVNGSGFRAIERVKKVHHTTIINWVKTIGNALPNAPDYDEIPEITQVDELETFVGKKKNKIWLWTAVNKHTPGILAWVLGDRSSETFKLLWQIIKCWQSYFYVTDGYAVYPCFISDEDHLVSKTYMTRVGGENSRLRHYLARLHRKTFCYSKSEEMLRHSIRLVIHYLKYGEDALQALCTRKFKAIA